MWHKPRELTTYPTRFSSGYFRTGSRRLKKDAFHLWKVDKVDRVVAVQFSVRIPVRTLRKRKEHGLEQGKIQKVDHIVIVEIRITLIAEAIAIRVALIGIGHQRAIVQRVVNRVAVAVYRQRHARDRRCLVPQQRHDALALIVSCQPILIAASKRIAHGRTAWMI